MAAQEQNNGTGSGLPSSLRSAIGALKGRTVSNDQHEEQPAPVVAGRNNEPPVVTVVPTREEELFPVSADMPENQIRKELAELRAQKTGLEQALNIANNTIRDLSGQLGEANDRIAGILLERNQGIEGIIGSLRKFQTDGAQTGPVGTAASALSNIFSASGRLTDRINEAGFNAKLEGDLRLALATMQAATGNAFSFDIETVERPDFYTSQGQTANPNYPAKLMVVNLKKSSGSSSTMKKDEKIVVIAIKNKAFYLKDSDFTAQFDRKAAFLNSTGQWQDGIFKWTGQNVAYDFRGLQGDPRPMKGAFDTIPSFVDEFVGRCLTGVVGSNEFDQAARGLKAMGLVP